MCWGDERNTEETTQDGKSVCCDCGEAVNKDGESIFICSYSEIICDTCGDAPCDGSC